MFTVPFLQPSAEAALRQAKLEREFRGKALLLAGQNEKCEELERQQRIPQGYVHNPAALPAWYSDN